MPHRTFRFHVFHFQIRNGRAQNGIPVHQAFATVNQPLVIKLHKHGGNGFGARVVHGEIFARPVGGTAHAAHLLRNRAAGHFFPFPHFFQEFFAPQVMAGQALRGEPAFHHNLRGNAGVVGAGNPAGVAAFHAVIARQAVHNGLVEGVAHVQRAGNVGRRQLDGETFGFGKIGGEIAFGFPVLIVFGFEFGGGVFVEHSAGCLKILLVDLNEK